MEMVKRGFTIWEFGNNTFDSSKRPKVEARLRGTKKKKRRKKLGRQPKVDRAGAQWQTRTIE